MKIKNNKLLSLLQKKEELLQEGKKQFSIVEKEQQKLNKIGLQIQKVKDKVLPIMAQYKQEWRESGVMGEFDDLHTVEIKNGEIEVATVDLVEEYKEALRKKRNEAAKPTGQVEEGNTSAA